jgi:hypothetical protein
MKLLFSYNKEINDFIQKSWLENNEINLYNICKCKYLANDELKNYYFIDLFLSLLSYTL